MIFLGPTFRQLSTFCRKQTVSQSALSERLFSESIFCVQLDITRNASGIFTKGESTTCTNEHDHVQINETMIAVAGCEQHNTDDTFLSNQ